MTGEIITIIAVGVAIIGVNWRMFVQLGNRIDRVERDLNDLGTRLGRVEGQLSVLVAGREV